MSFEIRSHQFTALIAIADHGGIRAAARSLHLSQTAVGRSIRALETELGVEVVTRTAYGVSLTEVGHVLCDRGRTMAAEKAAARFAIERLKGGVPRALRMFIAPVAAVTVLPVAYTAFRREMPDVNLQFVEIGLEDSLLRLRDGELDLIVSDVGALDVPGEFAQVDLGEDALVVACRSAHPMRHAVALRELVSCEWLVYTGNDVGSCKDEWAPPVLLPVRSARCIHCSSVFALIELLLSTDAIACLPRGLVDSAVLREGLTTLNVDLTAQGVHMRVLTRRHSQVSAPAQRMIDCLCDAARRRAVGRLERGAKRASRSGVPA